MAAPAQIGTLRSTDFPNGLASKADLEKLFQILNPFLQQAGAVTAKGTALGQNIDGHAASFGLTAAATFPAQVVRLPDGKKPVIALAWATVKGGAVVGGGVPAYTYLGQGKTGNLLRIDNVPGLTVGTQYTVNVFVFF